jgi:signal transduction histidine kinase
MFLGRYKDRLAGKPVPRCYEFRAIRKDGAQLWLEILATRVVFQGKPAVQAAFNDITERKQSEELLRSIAQGNRDAQEAERRRVARELHDSVSQLLASARLRTAAVLEGPTGRLVEQRRKLGRIDQLLARAGQEIRQIAYDLRPSELDDLGLRAAIRSLGADFSERTGLRLDMQLPLRVRRLAPKIELTLYRIIQEALHNVEKHAGASRVALRLDVGRKLLSLSITDNGRGLETTASGKALCKHAGMGLLNMRERAAAHHGTVDVLPVTGHGVEIRVRLPLDSNRQEELAHA